MSTWKYVLGKMWLAMRHRNVRMTRCSFHSTGKGWLVNLSLPVNKVTPNYTKEDIVALHSQLEAIAMNLAWMLESGDGIQFVQERTQLPSSSSSNCFQKWEEKLK